jgi:hypothetical protein
MKRFVMMHKADANIEAGVKPSAELIARMGELIGEMSSTGAFLAGEGLLPTSQGVRVRFTKGKRSVTRGPFVGSNELVASFAMIRVNSLDEAIECASRIGRVLGDADLYIGRVNEPWDIGLMPKPKGRATRYLILRKSDAKSEASDALDADIQAGLRPVIDDMTKAAVLLAAERLLPSKTGVRLTISKNKLTTVDGPFTESKELIAGYSIVRVATREETIVWAKRFGELLCEYTPVDSVEVDVRELADDSAFA